MSYLEHPNCETRSRIQLSYNSDTWREGHTNLAVRTHAMLPQHGMLKLSTVFSTGWQCKLGQFTFCKLHASQFTYANPHMHIHKTGSHEMVSAAARITSLTNKALKAQHPTPPKAPHHPSLHRRAYIGARAFITHVTQHPTR
jgi:hypothetical protein